MPFAPTLFDILLVASASGMSELLSLFSSISPATLHLASNSPDALWHVRNTAPDLLILEQGLRLDWQAPLDEQPLAPAVPHTLYLGHESGLASLPGWLAPAATALPWPGRPEPIREWIRRHMERHAGPAAPPSVLQAGPLRLDLHHSIVDAGHDGVTLTATEAQLLAMLIRQAGELVSRDVLGAACLDATPDPKKRRLDTHISNLRRKLQAAAGDSGASPRIHSHRGRGYMLTVVA